MHLCFPLPGPALPLGLLSTQEVMAMHVELKTLLCAIDFSDFSRQVIHCGIGLCRQLGTRMIIFHAVPLPSDRFRGAGVFQGEENRRSLSRQALQKIDALIGSAGANHQPIVSFGDPVEEVQRVAAAENVQLVVTASRGISGIRRMLLGTVVERMARSVSCPLLTLRPARPSKGGNNRTPFEVKQIVVGCDLLPFTQSALFFALELARRCGAALHLLHTIEAPADEDVADSPLSTYAQAQEAQQNRLRRRLGNLLPADAIAPGRLKTVLMAGNPGEAICSYASEVGADVIAVGVQPHGALDQILVGSTTEMLLRHAPCPVLTVPGRGVIAEKGA